MKEDKETTHYDGDNDALQHNVTCCNFTKNAPPPIFLDECNQY